jgi:pimeloyl-ACP methyl ester carboxylesterase
MPKTMELVEDGAGKKLKEMYDVVLTFDYENLDTPIEETAALLRDKLAGVGLGPDHGKTFHIIAHSMGGLVSRWFVEQLEGNKVVSKLIMLGTPNQGSPYGSLYEMATPLLATAVNGAAFLKPYILPIKYIGKFVDKMFSTLKQMNPDSEFLKALNVGTDPGIPYVIIAGNTQLIPFAVQDKQVKLLKKIMQRFKKRGHYDALDLLLFKAANDIAVSTQFIKEIPGADQWANPPRILESACDHLSYFGDPAGLECIEEVLLEA